MEWYMTMEFEVFDLAFLKKYPEEAGIIPIGTLGLEDYYLYIINVDLKTFI